MKLRLVRLNPLTLEPGEFFVMCGRNLYASNFAPGVEFAQFPARLEYWKTEEERERNPHHQLLMEEQNWAPVEFINEFQSDEGDDAREVRAEVQVPVYTKSTRNKRTGGDQGGEPS